MKKNKSKIFLAVGAVTVISVGGYFTYDYIQKQKKETDSPDETSEEIAPDTTSTTKTAITDTAKEKIKLLQENINSVSPETETKLKVDGIIGAETIRQYLLYKNKLSVSNQNLIAKTGKEAKSIISSRFFK